MARNKEKENVLFDKLKNKLSWFFYNLTQPIYAKLNKNKKNKKESTSGLRKKELIFYTPKAPIEDLPDYFLSWWPRRYDQNTDPKETLSCYGILNVATYDGFFTNP